MKDIYLTLYKEYVAKYGKNTCIFLEVGKFYEMYDAIQENGYGATSMQRAVEILGIQLSYRENKELFAGVPEQSLHKYGSMLTKQGWTVVVVGQIKNIQNKVVERKVSHILSPGTHIESFSADSAFLGCLYLEETKDAPKFSISAVDVSTGRCISFSGKLEGKYDSWNFDRLLHFVQVHPIKEMLVFYNGLTLPSESYLQQNLVVCPMYIKQFELGVYKLEKAREDVYKVFQNSSMNSMLSIWNALGIEKGSISEYSLTFLLNFLQDHYPSIKLQSHTNWNPEKAMYLGNNVLNQLNMIGGESILSFFQKTYTPMGRRDIVEHMLYPISCPAQLKKRVDEIEEVLNMKNKETITYALKQICDLPRVHQKFFTYNLNADDILALDQSYIRAMEIMEALGKDIIEVKKYHLAFLSKFDIEKAKVACADISFFNSVGPTKTRFIEEHIAHEKNAAHAFLNKLLEDGGLPKGSLHFEEKETAIYSIEGTQKNLRILEAKLANKGRKDVTITIRKSGGCLTSALLEECHRKTLAFRASLKEAVKKELPALCNFLADEYRQIWLSLENYISQIDIIFTIARVSKEKGFTKPIYEEGESSFSIKGLRHPLIENQSTHVEYVCHDVCLDGNGWLLYGMNASGKSSLMKAVGIAVLLAQVGCYVPAASLTLKPYKSLYTRILNQDNIHAGLSSFAVEMLELREILKSANCYSLVLGDELCSGTESVSATALVASGILWLSQRNVSFIFATHLHGLNDIKELQTLTSLKVWHLKVHYDAAADLLIYDRRLEPGSGSTYYGLEVAKAMNIPFEFLEIAHRIRKDLLNQTTRISSYNSECIVKECEICKTSISHLLEVHHIAHQKDGGSNDLRNLIVVCQACHDAHHAGMLEIAQAKQTSEGVKRMVKKSESESNEKSNERNERNERNNTVLEYMKKYPNMALKRLAYELETNEDIKLSESTLRTIKKSSSSDR